MPVKNLNLDDDFGFSLVSESELKSYEQQLKKKVEEQTRVVAQTSEQTKQMQDKLHTLRDMVMPLLNNLAKDPSKEYILWPDRAVKIQAFIKKINDFVES